VDDVVPRRLALGHAETDDERHSVGDALGDFLRREAVAAAIVFECVFARRGELAALLEFFRRAEAAIRGAGVEHAARVGLMTRKIRALIHDFFVPVRPSQFSPSKIARVDSSVLRALSVSSMRSRNWPPC